VSKIQGQAPTLASLFQNLPADGPIQRVYAFGSATAAVVAEGAVKPPSGLVISPQDIALLKIATTVQYTSEFAEDAPWLLSHLASELTQAVAVAENASILSAFGSTSGILTGTGTTVTAIDVIGAAIAAAEALNGVTPNAVVVHPSVLGVLRAAKASTAGSF
jgi:HK97 family phage major capsid protein